MAKTTAQSVYQEMRHSKMTQLGRWKRRRPALSGRLWSGQSGRSRRGVSNRLSTCLAEMGPLYLLRFVYSCSWRQRTRKGARCDRLLDPSASPSVRVSYAVFGSNFCDSVGI